MIYVAWNPSFTFIPLVLLYWIAPVLYKARPRRKRESGFGYVHIENDGTARELDADEREYLNTEFSGMDGGRPYIKDHYEELTPDHKLHGYLPRRRVPRHIAIRPIGQITVKGDFVWIESYEGEPKSSSNNRIQIPLNHIRALYPYPGVPLSPLGHKVSISSAPSSFTVYRYRDANILWLANEANSTLVMDLVDEQYQKVIIEVADPIITTRHIYSAILDRGLEFDHKRGYERD